MVYTRGQNSAASALLALRGPVSFTRYTLSYVASTPSQSKFWSHWTNWYHTFLSEATDEYPSLSIAERRAEATSRWVSYTAKQVHCSESQVRAWLRTADQKALTSAYA